MRRSASSKIMEGKCHEMFKSRLHRGIGLVAYRRGWFSKRRYCSQHCRNGFVADARQKRQRPVLKRLVFAFLHLSG